MERKIISHRIGSILDDISRLSNALYAMDTTDIQRYPDNYEVLSTDAALRAEKIACRLRHLIYSSTTIRKGDYLTSAGIVHGIEVVYEDGVLEVTLPGLLPKRKQRQNTEFLLDPFYFALEQYAKEHPMPRFSDCVVCFTQVYDQCLPTRRIRDYDNLEEKQLLERYADYEKATNDDVEGIKTAKTGAAVVMNVNTGQVLAMASYPSFNPNWFIAGLSPEQNQELFNSEFSVETTPTRNKAISTKLAPGSIFKMATGVAAAAEGVLDINERISCDYEYIIKYTDENGNEKTIEQNAPKCHLNNRSKIGQHANQTLADAIKNSCNYYFCEAAYRLGIDKLNEWAGKFGLTSRTGIELTGETEGIVGGQKVLFDNTLTGEDGTLDIANQKTSLPGLVYRKLKETLVKFVESRNAEVDEEAINRCAKRLMELQDGDITNKGPEIRRIISEEIDIPEGITQMRKDWINSISSLLNEIQWKPTQTIRAGFGQGTTLVTPVAVARYVSALANRGTVYDVHIVDKVMDSSGSTVKNVAPSVYNQIEISDDIWDAVSSGMKGVVSPEDGGTASSAFKDYPEFRKKYIDTEMFGGKTGSAQIGRRAKNIDIENTSWFVTFAPREQPEIAIVICVPYGLSGSSSVPAIVDILTYYFGQSENAAPENLVAINGLTE